MIFNVIYGKKNMFITYFASDEMQKSGIYQFLS